LGAVDVYTELIFRTVNMICAYINFCFQYVKELDFFSFCSHFRKFIFLCFNALHALICLFKINCPP
jgi:hypothetical protein